MQTTVAEVEELADQILGVEGTLIKKYQKCGKKGCKCASGNPGSLHGPYHWRVKSVKVGHRQYKQIWKFIGKM